MPLTLEEQNAVAVFQQDTIRMARSLSPRRARLFLKGALLCSEHARENTRLIEKSYDTIRTLDSQLELFQSQADQRNLHL